MADIPQDRRRALRVHVRSFGDLATADGHSEAHLLNISENGALVAVLDDHQLAAGEAVSIQIELPDQGSARMEGHVAHVRGHMLGLDCTAATDEDAGKIEAVIDRLLSQGDKPPSA